MQSTNLERRPTRPPLGQTAETWPRGKATRALVALTATALLAVLSVASTGAANASPRPIIATVHGIELVAEHTQGTFSGYTSGGLTGGWLATVNHTPLDPNARITGGTFTLVTKLDQLEHPLTARIGHGSITMTNPGANCTNQTFTVTGNLTHLTGNRTGSFSLTLTHWRHNLLGTCLSYFATTSGSLTLTR
jgi:hypothetical protein